jgi:hypothetical protein
MGRRSEPRIVISFPAVLRGFDSQGKPFAASAETCDVSNSGASLRGLNGLLEPGKKIEIEFRDQSAWFRVQWVGGAGSRAGRVGVRCLERKYIWEIPAPDWQADTYNPAQFSTDLGLRTASFPPNSRSSEPQGLELINPSHKFLSRIKQQPKWSIPGKFSALRS